MRHSNRLRSKSSGEPLDTKIEREQNPLKRFLLVLGRGLITGADDDPSGIATYTTAGATLGFATLWTAVVTLPVMAAVQFICEDWHGSRTRTGGGLAQTLSALVSSGHHRAAVHRQHD